MLMGALKVGGGHTPYDHLYDPAEISTSGYLTITLDFEPSEMIFYAWSTTICSVIRWVKDDGVYLTRVGSGNFEINITSSWLGNNLIISGNTIKYKAPNNDFVSKTRFFIS